MKNLKEWCSENNEKTLLELYENGDNKYKSDEIGFSSPRVVNFKCKKCGTKWKQTLNKMNQRKNKECPYCLHYRPSYMYNFQTEYPELAKEWNYERNKKKPYEYLPNSGEKAWWKCRKGHVWQRVIKDVVSSMRRSVNIHETFCPVCNNEKVSGTYNLVTEFPEVAREWNYIKNGSLIPLEVSPKSSKKVWWQCKYNPEHIWADKIGNRTVLNRSCPICSKKFTISFPSRAIYFYLKKTFDDCEMEYKILDKYITDICIPYYKIIIEYDGWYYHSSDSVKKREKVKDKLFKENGYEVIRIKDIKEKIEGVQYENNIIKFHLLERKENLNELIEKVIFVIKEKTNMSVEQDINIQRDYQKIEDLYYHVRKSNSLAVKYPELAKQWSKNNDITPDNISTGTSQNVKWICPNCNGEYIASVHNRVKIKSNCPYCSNRKVKVNKENSLSYLFPEIAKEWDYEKNGDLKPTEITKGCDKKVWWKCEKGHSWETRVYLRTGKRKSNCPYCTHTFLTYENSLEARNPELKQIWNYDKNEGKTTKDFSYSSNKIVWWKCKKGHEWQSSINKLQRIKSKEKCPYCRNVKLCKENSLAAVNKKLAKEWNYEKNTDLIPEKVLFNSTQKVWWKCENSHEWIAPINVRNRGTGCPYCKNVKVSFNFSLAQRGKKLLLEEWDYEKNIDIKPENVSLHSGKKVWWKCKEGHEWIETVSHRSSGRNCPYCSGRRVSDKNSLLKNGRKILLEEWDYEKNKGITPETISVGSGKKVWWKCKKGHEWCASVDNRTKGRNCPFCWEERRGKKQRK